MHSVLHSVGKYLHCPLKYFIITTCSELGPVPIERQTIVFCWPNIEYISAALVGRGRLSLHT